MASAGILRVQCLSVYKSLLRESEKFTAYNMRSYALRRVKDAFRENKKLKSNDEIKDAMLLAQNTLHIIKRQVVIGQLYSSEKLVIENVAAQ